ncbi:MAG: hypothetical protein IJ774_05350 [Selenomonadaceae bacterium]|nr:hypothetical protein [Selenomonadaceae bacterium]MBR1805800.1 hypothetical protein [Selenomonadaceae bacterium]
MADLSEILSAGLNLTDDQLAQLAANASAWRDAELNKLAEDVARAKEGTKLTRNGFELLGKAVAGKELQFTRVKLGDANGVVVDDDEQFEMNDLINPRFEAAITQVQHTGGGCMAVKCQVTNARVEEGFRIAEVGLFAIDPDTGEELMYCYRNSGIASSWMPSGDGSVLWDIVLTLITVIDKATNITAVIDGGLVYLTQAEFMDHVNSENPHPNIPAKADEVDFSNYIWVNPGDDKLHTMKASVLGSQILGGDASNIPKMNSRLTQAEINLTNLYTQLNARDELGLDANLMMIEPFDDKKCCDMYSCKVQTAVAGVANVEIETDRNVFVGSWYTITDGENSEYVQVKSVARNGDKTVVIFNQPLNLTYDLTRTRLLRTTALINNGKATGAGDIRGKQLTFDYTFSGVGENVETQLELHTNQTNAANFTVTEDGTFSVDGFFTLTA